MALYQNGTLIGTATNLSPQYDSSMLLTIGGSINSASATTPYLAFPAPPPTSTSTPAHSRRPKSAHCTDPPPNQGPRRLR